VFLSERKCRGLEQITHFRVLSVHFTIYCNGYESKESSMGGRVALVEEMRNSCIIFGKIHKGNRLHS
jgi:hypothetical protein